LRPSKRDLNRAAKARRASSRATFQKLLRDRAAVRRDSRPSGFRPNGSEPASEEIFDDQGVTFGSDSESNVSEETGTIFSDSFYASTLPETESLASRPIGRSPLLEASRIEVARNLQPKRSIGPFWEFEPCPLSLKEERKFSKNQRFSGKGLPYGDYSVAPNRYDLKNFQRLFWIGREIRQLVIIISLVNFKSSFKDDLLFARNQIFLLGNGSGKLTSFQRKLLASVYYCLRQCSTDY
jgi:hypothetical protein